MIGLMHIHRTKAPRRNAAMIALAGGVAAATMLSIPGGLLEIAVASSGLSEIMTAAAPPLGLTARIVLACGAALAAMGIAMAIQRPGQRPSQQPALRSNGSTQAKEKQMGFAFSRLADFARGHRRGTGEAISLARRSEDAHPDAPPRRPIFASEDFAGAEIFRRNPAMPAALPASDPMAAHLADIIAMPEVVTRQAIAPAVACAREPAPAPGPVAPVQVTIPDPVVVAARPVAAPAPVAAPLHAPHIAPLPAAPAPLPRAPVTGLSLGELTARFEEGLARRDRPVRIAAVAPTPVAPQPAPIASTPAPAPVPAPRIPTLAELPPVEPVALPPMLDADIDEALRAALGTLQKMAVRGR